MSIQAMILALKNNKRNRRSPFDKKNIARSSFGEFVDYKELKTYEYAAFQKKLFKEKTRQKRRRIVLYIVTAVLVVLLLLLVPYVVEVIFDPSYTSIKFQN